MGDETKRETYPDLWQRGYDHAVEHECPKDDPNGYAHNFADGAVWGIAVTLDVLGALAAMSKTCRANAADLRREVNNGVCIRQSAESKLARVAVLESVADHLDRIAKEPR